LDTIAANLGQPRLMLDIWVAVVSCETDRSISMQEYEFYIESDYGVSFDIIEARDEKHFIEILKQDHKQDIGADGFYNCPKTGKEIAINWSI